MPNLSVCKNSGGAVKKGEWPDAVLGCVQRSLACNECEIILVSCATKSKLYLRYGVTSSKFEV